tara:strand:+ start:1266 stop:2216 length:951 start_codon:yes stop_codon:yes gene_type:complete
VIDTQQNRKWLQRIVLSGLLSVGLNAQFNIDVFADKSDDGSDYSQTVIDRAAFNELKETVSPMSQEQIREIKRLWSESKRASTIQAVTPPKPVNSSILASLENGAQPSIVRLSAGVISVVSFFDSSGQPWPIQGYNVGNPSVVSIVWNDSTAESEKAGNTYSNTLMMQAQSLYKPTNMVVLLRGMGTPVLLELIPGQQEVDYRLDVQIPRTGPNTQQAYPSTSISTDTKHQSVLMDVLNNIAPAKAKKLQVRGGDAQAWLVNKKLYVRTALELISPAWSNRVNGANNNMHVYELPYSATVVALKNGRIVHLQMEGD